MAESYKLDVLKKQLKEKVNGGSGVGLKNITGRKVKGLDDAQVNEILDVTRKELEKTETAHADRLAEFPDLKKAYLDRDAKADPFYIDYNLIYTNHDMLMALSYSNEMKAMFIGSDESDLENSDIITKTAEYDYKEEMGMDLIEYEMGMDKFLGGVAVVIWDSWNAKTNTPVPIVASLEHVRFDPIGRGSADKFRWIGFFGKMTKYQMKEHGYMNVDDVVETDRKNDITGNNQDNGKKVTITADHSDDETAYFVVYNHFRTMRDGRKCLVTCANSGKTLLNYVIFDYKIGDKRVFPISLDYWKAEKGNSYGVRPYDLSGRKQKVLSLLLNLAVKKSVRSSLGNHIIVDGKAVKNRNQLKQLTEFPEIIIVDTNNGALALGNTVMELQRSQVPQDNYNVTEVIKQLNAEETSIGPNQLGISAQGQQTATEIKDNAANSNVRLSLTNRVSFIGQTDFWKKRFMMYQYHFPQGGTKVIAISRDFGNRYMTFTDKYLNMSGDPHIKIVSKFDIEQKNKQQFVNHVVLHTYIDQLSNRPKVPLSVRLSLRKALRLMGYNEDEILDYVQESMEEIDAKDQLLLLNRGESLEKLDPSQVDEEHEAYLHIFAQAKDTNAKRDAIRDRLMLLRERKKKEAKNMQIQQGMDNSGTNAIKNQMTGNMINQQNTMQPSLQDIKM